MERKHGHQKPDQQCLERAVHHSVQYSTGVFAG
jgi:hypothetical protein